MNDSVNKTSIAVVGLGNMGSALAAALLARGYEVTVWNRTASKADALIEQGAKLAADVAAAAAQAEAMIVCVADHAAIKAVVHDDAVARALEDKCLIQLGVVTPAEALENADWAQSHGTGYLEGSILGVPDNIAASAAIIVCSGPPEQYAERKPILETFGSTHHLSSAIGAAYQADKMFYPFGYGATLGFVQGAAMAKAAGYSLEAYTNILLDWMKSLSGRLETFGDLIDKENFTVYQATLEVWHAAYGDALELCQSLSVDDTLPKAHLAMLGKGINEGYGEEEILAVFKTLLPK